MKTYIYSALVAALTLTSHAVASRLTNVSLTFENGSTVAKVDIEGQIRFTHQAEIPKNGKPDRMILDVIGVTNDFETKSFTQLPVCGVTGIRTSQYAVMPEKVVRLVFDMTKAPVYRVESDHSSIRVIFTDNSVKPFATWMAITKGASRSVEPKPAPRPIAVSDKGVPPAPATTPVATATTQNKNIEQDRQSSLASKGTPSSRQTSKTPTSPVAEKPKTAPATQLTADNKPIPATPPTATGGSKPAVAVASAPSAVQPSPRTATVTPTPDKPKSDIASQQKGDAKPSSTSSPNAVAATQPIVVARESKAASPAVAPTQTIPAQPKVEFSSTPDHESDDVATTNKPDSKPSSAIAKNESKPAPADSPVPGSSKSTTITSSSTPTTLTAKSPTASPVTASTSKSATAPDTKSQPSSSSPVVAQNTSPKVSVTYTPDKSKADDKVESKPPTTSIIATNMTGKNSEKNPEAPKPTPASSTPSATASTSLPLIGPLPAAGPSQISSTPTVVQNDSSSRSLAEGIAATDKRVSDTVAEPASPAADETAALTPTDTTKSTSRFRRSPELSSKIKGTMIAEFPKRLVIKYDPGPNRDPFATLADNTRTYDSPVETRIPNVEGLKLVGIIQSNSGDNRALFEDKKNYSYILKSGDRVLRGNVLRVESDRVYFQIFEYGWSRTIALTIDDNFGR